ncbi:hypothetical protein [Streptomyces sp. NPDC058092]|uniref:hypothetical protein n=1 Tax=Streptomyces sp. NPDC058092 TaxID=3346336 RepID=UPI0036E5232D
MRSSLWSDCRGQSFRGSVHERRRLDLIRALDRRQQPDASRDAGPDAVATEAEIRWAFAHRLHENVTAMNLDHFLARPHRREVETYSDFTNWHRIDDGAEALIHEHLLALPSAHQPDETESAVCSISVTCTKSAAPSTTARPAVRTTCSPLRRSAT